ncbi:MAG: hypothetical protein V1809_09340 [Planctomycetota bacterium]
MRYITRVMGWAGVATALFAMGCVADPAGLLCFYGYTRTRERILMEKESSSGGFVFQRKGRRDPFAVPAPAERGGDTATATGMNVTRQKELLDQAENLSSRLGEHYQSKDYNAVEMDYRELGEVLSQTYTDAEVITRIRRIKEQTNDILAKAGINAAEVEEKQRFSKVEQKAAEVKRAYAAGEYDRVLTAYDALMACQNTPLRDPDRVNRFQALLAEGKGMAERARLIQNLRQKSIQVSMIAFEEGGGSIAIVNGKIRREGDVLDKGGDNLDKIITVKRIERERVSFDCQGEEVVKEFK